MPEAAVEIYSPKDFADAKESRSSKMDVDKDAGLLKEAREALVRRCYPGLKDLLGAAAIECKCLSCTLGTDSSATKQLKSGCLKFYAYSTVLSLVAHSVADAFGADDISGSQETALQANSPNPDIYRVESILLDVAQHSRIVWQTWFEVAAHVFLGHRYANVGASAQVNGYMRSDDSMAIAIQHGELAVVAPWIDLSMKITHQGSFGLPPCTRKAVYTHHYYAHIAIRLPTAEHRLRYHQDRGNRFSRNHV